MYHDGTHSELHAFFHKPWVVGVLILDVVVILVMIGLAIFNATRDSVISFTVTPVDATISVNGDTESYSNGTYKIHPGTYDIIVSKDGFTAKTFSFDLQSDSSVAITTFLTQNGSLEFYELKENYASFQQLVNIASAEGNVTTDHDTSAEEFISKMNDNVKLYQTVLPIRQSESWSADAEILESYGYLENLLFIQRSNSERCRKLLCVGVSAFGIFDVSMADSVLQEAGFDVDYLEILYAEE